MKKVLIITYYWPPSGGAGVQRWLKFSKYLPDEGWEPIVVTPENPSFINQDESLMEEAAQIEVLKLPIWEPYSLAKKVRQGVHQKDVDLSDKQGLKSRITVWIRGNLLIPDPRRFWIRPAVSFLKHYLEEKPVDVIVTTGPPHSVHLIGLRLKRKLGVPWLADFRDPWSQWDLLDKLKVSKLARWRHRALERKVISHCDHLISVGWEMDRGLKSLGADPTTVITNGFDHTDFGKDESQSKGNNEFLIRHIGSIDELRDPRPFVRLLGEMIIDGQLKNVKLEFIGNVTPTVIRDLTTSPYTDFVRFRPYVPHKEVIRIFRETDLLLLVLAHSHSAKLNITGKIFEYIASGCQILGIGDTAGDAARVLRESGRGVVMNRNDDEGIRSYLKEAVQNTDREEIDLAGSPYSRKNLTRQLASILNLLSQ